MVRRRTHDFEVSVGPVQSIKTMRLIAEEFNWSCRRLEGSRLVDRFAIIMPMAQATRTLTYKSQLGLFQGLNSVLGPKQEARQERSISSLGPCHKASSMLQIKTSFVCGPHVVTVVLGNGLLVSGRRLEVCSLYGGGRRRNLQTRALTSAKEDGQFQKN